MPDSIQRRLMLTSSAVLVIFLTATGLLLDRTFSQSVTEGAQQQLQLVQVGYNLCKLECCLCLLWKAEEMKS